jgi:hypothetical protein
LFCLKNRRKEKLMEKAKITFWDGPEDINVRAITIPSEVNSIKYQQFIFQRELEEVVLPEGLLTIGESAFGHCERLAKINLPSTLRSIGPYAFSDCTSLPFLSIPEGCKVSPSAFIGTVMNGKIQAERLLSLEHIPYSESMGKIKDQSLIEKTLRGLSLEDQFAYFTVRTSSTIERSSSDESSWSNSPTDILSHEVKNLIIRDGIIVGILMDSTNIIVGNTERTYYDCEDNGSGFKERSDYCSLSFDTPEKPAKRYDQ